VARCDFKPHILEQPLTVPHPNFQGTHWLHGSSVSGVLRTSQPHESPHMGVLHLQYGPRTYIFIHGQLQGADQSPFLSHSERHTRGRFQETVGQHPEDKKHPSVPVRVEFNKLQKSLVSNKCSITLRQNAWQTQYDNGMVNMEIMRQVCSVQGRLVKRTGETAAEWYRQHKNKVGGTTKIENSWLPIDTSVMTSTDISFRFEQTLKKQREFWNQHIISLWIFFLYNKTNQMHQSPKFTPAWNSTRFRQFLCPSSGIYSLYTRHWYMSYRFEDSFRVGPGWNCYMTYTCAECTVNKLLMMDRGTARNM